MANLLILYIRRFACKDFISDNDTVVNTSLSLFTTVPLSLLKPLLAKLMYRINKCALKSILIVLYINIYILYIYIYKIEVFQ